MVGSSLKRSSLLSVFVSGNSEESGLRRVEDGVFVDVSEAQWKGGLAAAFAEGRAWSGMLGNGEFELRWHEGLELFAAERWVWTSRSHPLPVAPQS